MIQLIKARFPIIGKIIVFLWKNKFWWLIPVILVAIVIFIFMIFVQAEPLGPMIYSLIIKEEIYF